MILPHHFNAATLLVTGVVCAARLRPDSPFFTGEAIFTASLFLLALASLWLWAMAYTREQHKRKRNPYLLARALYRRTSTRKIGT